MKVDIVTLFPEIIEPYLSSSILGRARQKGVIEIGYLNPRIFTKDKHKTVDDRPYGGGAGMLMKAEPLYQALKQLKKQASANGTTPLIVMTSPRGKVFNQKLAKELAKEKQLIIVCGHYEGVDARIYPEIDLEISLGDFILTGGEIAACAIVDAVARLQEGTFVKQDVTTKESFEDNLLEAPQYTRPEVWRRRKVPAVLLSGNHKEIENWKQKEALKITKKLRPDLLDNRPLKTSEENKKRLKRRKQKL